MTKPTLSTAIDLTSNPHWRDFYQEEGITQRLKYSFVVAMHQRAQIHGGEHDGKYLVPIYNKLPRYHTTAVSIQFIVFPILIALWLVYGTPESSGSPLPFLLPFEVKVLIITIGCCNITGLTWLYHALRILGLLIYIPCHAVYDITWKKKGFCETISSHCVALIKQIGISLWAIPRSAGYGAFFSIIQVGIFFAPTDKIRLDLMSLGARIEVAWNRNIPLNKSGGWVGCLRPGFKLEGGGGINELGPNAFYFAICEKDKGELLGRIEGDRFIPEAVLSPSGTKTFPVLPDIGSVELLEGEQMVQFERDRIYPYNASICQKQREGFYLRWSSYDQLIKNEMVDIDKDKDPFWNQNVMVDKDDKHGFSRESMKLSDIRARLRPGECIYVYFPGEEGGEAVRKLLVRQHLQAVSPSTIYLGQKDI